MIKTKFFNAYIKKNRSFFIKELSDFIKIESIASNKNQVEKAVNFLSYKLKKIGFRIQIIKIKKSNPFIIGEIGEGKKTILIYDHYDVMSAGNLNEWTTPPFTLTQKNDVLYGRGLADNKGHLMLRLQAIDTILKNRKKLPIKIKFVIEGEEEIGSPHIHKFSDKYSSFLKDADLCLWESGDVDERGRPNMFLGMKGIAYFLLSCQIGKNDLHSGYATLVESAAWRLVQALNTLRDKNGKVLIKNLIKKIKKPDNYIKKLIKENPVQINQLLASLGKDNLLSQKTKEEEVLLDHFYGISCNICGIWSGSINEEIKTILPNKAFAKIDFRLVEKIDSKKVKKYLISHLRKQGFNDINVKEIINEPVAVTNHNNKNFKKAISIIEQSYGKKVIITPYAKGSGPMYYIASKFKVPSIQLGAQMLNSNIHGPNENIKVDNYFKALQATIDLIVNF